MIKINSDYLKLQSSYLFAEISNKIKSFSQTNPNIEIIKLGIGDVTKPLPPACVEAFHTAIDEMTDENTFKGYGPYEGYEFLREKVAAFDFHKRGVNISTDEIFISDGAKCDTGNIQELFSSDIKIAISDPVYPVYIDTNVMAGRTGAFTDGRYKNVLYLESTRENKFIPDLPSEPVDLIYLCFPNNPTGTTITKEGLKKWVDFARDNKALILFDAAYEAFITDDSLPHSIFEIEGADEVAIEFRSFSKTAGFTGIRCAYTVVPKKCTAYDDDGNEHNVNELWKRRCSTKFNGVSYPVQRAAAAVYSEEGQEQVKNLISYYMKNAALIREEIKNCGYDLIGGINSPYIWIDCKMGSWEFFDLLLNKANVVCTPGEGFGKCGRGFARISAFNDYNNVLKAMDRIKKI